MLNCHNATKLMSESQERGLSVTEQMSLKLHVIMCKGCNNFQEQMGALRKITRTYAKRKSDQVNK
jgi:hypothetical protein